MKRANLFPSMRTGSAHWQTAILHRLVVIGLMLLCCTPSAWSENFSEYRLKAAFLYNFAVFTAWPPEVGSVLNLCVFGDDPFGAEIDGINGKTIGARKLAVQHKTNLGSLKGCHIVFVPATDIGQLPRLLDTLRDMPVLTVTESPSAVHQGAALNMTIVQGQVTFEANLVAARRAHLMLSSKMLRLATEVIQ